MKRIASVALALMLLLSAAPIGPVGTTAAAGAGEECSALDDFVYFITIRNVNEDSCSRQAYANGVINEMKESDANQTKVDIYNGGVSLKSDEETFMAPFDNYLTDTQSPAWMKAQVAVASAYKSGMNESQAQAAARDAIADYYAVKQANLADRWNATASDTMTLYQEAAQEDGISTKFVSIHGDHMDYSSEYHDGFSHETAGLSTEQVTLVNGTTISSTVLTAEVRAVSSGGAGGSRDYHWSVDSFEREDNTYPANLSSQRITVEAPNENFTRLEMYAPGDYLQRWTRIENLSSNLQAESDVFVANTYDDFASGAINASDVIDGHTAMFEYGIRSGNSSEGLWRTTAALSTMGFDTPTLTDSGTMTVEYQGETHSGLVMARNAPNGSWQTGATYYPSSFDGPVFLLTTNGTKIDLTESFEITGMTAKDGTPINTTQTTKYVYRTSNTSELLELQQQLIELRQEIEDREPDSGGSGTGGGMNTETMLIGLLLAAGAGVLLSRN